MQDTSVQSPRLRAVCQQPAGHDLRPLAGGDGRPEAVGRDMKSISGQSQCQRRAGVVGPDLRRIGHPVPARLFAGAQQVVDGSGVAAAALCRHMSIGLDEMAAFGMRAEPQPRDERSRLVAQVWSFGTVAAIAGRLAYASYQRARFGRPARQFSAPKRKSR